MFLSVHSDIGPQLAAKLRVRTYVALPATMRPPGDTKKNILYRDDFDPVARDEGSVVENLHSDIMAQSNIQPGGSLAVTLGLDKIKPPTQEILDLYKTITARYVGVGSIHPMKDYRNFMGWIEPTPTYVSLPTQKRQETTLPPGTIIVLTTFEFASFVSPPLVLYVSAISLSIMGLPACPFFLWSSYINLSSSPQISHNPFCNLSLNSSNYVPAGIE